MIKSSGTIRRNGTVGYIPQEAFLINNTIQENITFGNTFNREKYEQTIDICQLRSDLDQFEGRDQTEIGERGINVSGGQKQRVAIARAVYSDSQIYLIDDALSALDAHVGKRIMQDVFQKKLQGTTRIMVTHHLHL